MHAAVDYSYYALTQLICICFRIVLSDFSFVNVYTCFVLRGRHSSVPPPIPADEPDGEDADEGSSCEDGDSGVPDFKDQCTLGSCAFFKGPPVSI